MIVGSVSLGPGGMLTEAIKTLSGGSLPAMLLLTAVGCLILGMGLPTTANYIVMATLTAGVIVDLSEEWGLAVPLIAAHLFVFFFGILADDTPPVGLAAYAASAIAKSPPIRTGVQGFLYDIRTALLPFMFIFNTRLLLIGVRGVVEVLYVFTTTCAAMMAFAALTQGHYRRPNRWWDAGILALISLTILRPGWVGGLVGLRSAENALPGLAVVLFIGLGLLQVRRSELQGASA
jgi:TRAP-type uncharacterized transport system fused permease subunit